MGQPLPPPPAPVNLPTVDPTTGDGQPQPAPPPVSIPQQPSLPSPPALTHGDSAADPAVDTDHPERSAAPSLTTGVFKFDAPSSFITPSTIEYWETIPGGQSWVRMVNAYLQLEQTPIPQGVCSFFLSTRNLR